MTKIHKSNYEFKLAVLRLLFIIAIRPYNEFDKHLPYLHRLEKELWEYD